MCAKQTIATRVLPPKSKASSTTAVSKGKVSELDVKYVLHLNDDEDTKAVMLLNLVEGLDLHKAVRHARAQMARERRWQGVTQPRLSKTQKNAGVRILAPDFSYLDHAETDELSPHEKIAYEIEAINEISQKSHTHELSKSGESMLGLVCQGTAAVAKLFGVTQRRAQQKVVETVKKIESENEFRNGRKGQGGLF